MNNIICEAIHSRRIIRCYYKGGYRLFEPYCHGVSTAHNDALRAYQVGGYSKSGKPFSWKLLVMNEMRDISITDDSFDEIRPDYNPNDKQMIHIYCRV